VYAGLGFMVWGAELKVFRVAGFGIRVGVEGVLTSKALRESMMLPLSVHSRGEGGKERERERPRRL